MLRETETKALREEIARNERSERLHREQMEAVRVEELRRHTIDKENRSILFSQEQSRKEQDHRHEMERIERTIGATQHHQMYLSMMAHNNDAFRANMAQRVAQVAPVATPAFGHTMQDERNVFQEARVQLQAMENADANEG